MEQVLALQSLNKILHGTQNFQALLKNILAVYCENGLYALKFHITDQVVEDLDRYRCVELLSSTVYRCFNVHVKCGTHLTLQCRTSTLRGSISRRHEYQHEKKCKK